MRVVVGLLFLAVFLLPAAVSAQAAPPWPDGLCQRGEAWACVESGTRLARTGADRDATERFWRACAADEPDGCNRVEQMLAAQRGGGFDFVSTRARLKAGCDKSQARACLALGHLHTIGAGGERSHDLARKLYTTACKLDPWACSGLGWQLELGLGVTKDPALAVTRYRQACQAKNLAGGCRVLAALVGDTLGPKVRDQACKAGEPVACFELGRHERACTLGVSASCREHARALVAKGDLTTAEGPYRQACGVGDGAACGELGALRLQANDGAGAAKLFEYACAAKDATACMYLGVMLAQGRGGVTADPPRAVGLLRQACDGGLAEACGQLGVALVQGLGGTVDAVAGAALIQRACDGGRAASCGDLGQVYLNGLGVTADPAKARAMFDKACAAGHAASCAAAKAPAAKPKAPARPKDMFEREADVAAEAKALEATCDRDRDGAACYRAAILVRNGLLLRKEPDWYGRLFAKGCQLDHAEACGEAGGEAHLRRGCDLGSGNACLRLGDLVRDKDRAAAQTHYLRACELRAAQGCAMAGVNAEVQGRHDEARRLYRSGCELKNPLACEYAGKAAERAGDLTEARTRYQAGCDLKYDSACKALARMK